MPKPIPATGEAMPTIDRRTLLQGLFVAAVIPSATNAVASDPLLSTIHEYQRGLEDWIKNGPEDNEGAMAYSDITYGPPLARLQQWTQPATTRDGAIAALKLAVDDDNGVRGMEAEARMVKAALDYLESLPA